jgi:hypothetical protein
MNYLLGNTVLMRGTFFDEEGAPIDPTTVICRVSNPQGAVTALSGGAVIRESQGRYRAQIVPDQAGLWTYRFEGAGAVQAAAEREFWIRAGAL